MKKLLLAVIACGFIASPALANDFAAQQTKVLGDIIAQMDQAKNDPAMLDALTAKRNCVEKATKVEDLQQCMEEPKADTKG